MMRRGILLTVIGVALILAMTVTLAAETADIALGGGLVARLRDKGTFSSVAARAAHVDKQITEVVSTKDTLHPQVTMKQDRAGLWTVYAWETAVLSVMPAEAQANRLTEKQMGAMWAANLKRQLPLATPCSKLPPEMLGYGKPGAKPAGTMVAATTPVAKPATAAAPVAKPVVKPVPAVKPAVVVKPAATPVVKPAAKPVVVVAKPPAAPLTPVAGATETGALLLIVDAMRAVRAMDDQAWVAQKESLARSLYGDLGFYLLGKGTAPVVVKPAVKPAVPVVKPVVKPATPVVKPVVKPAAPVVKPVVKPVAPVVKPVVKPATPVVKPAVKPVVKPVVVVAKPAVDPSMARVPQKNRIREKFGVAKPAYDKLAASDAEAAKPVAQLLADSRQAFAKGDFDTSERLVDEALKTLNVPFK